MAKNKQNEGKSYELIWSDFQDILGKKKHGAKEYIEYDNLRWMRRKNLYMELLIF